MSINLNRRHVVAGAAWSVPAITIASAAPAFAVTPPSLPPGTVQWQDVSLTVYSRVRTLVTSPITNRTDGVSRVDYTFRLPQYVAAGADVPAQPISYRSYLGTAATNSAYSAGGRTVESGHVNVTYNLGGGMTAPTASAQMTLTPGNVSMPSSGQLQTTFTGTMPALKASTTAGTYAISFQNPGEPVESDAATWNGTQTVVTSFFGIKATARVHSMVPDAIPGTGWGENDWGATSNCTPPPEEICRRIAEYTVVPVG